MAGVAEAGFSGDCIRSKHSTITQIRLLLSAVLNLKTLFASSSASTPILKTIPGMGAFESSLLMLAVASQYLVLALLSARRHLIASNLLVILLKSCEILPSFAEFAFFHAFANIPVDKCPFRVHEIKLVIQTAPSLRNGGCVGKHANRPVDRGELATRD